MKQATGLISPSNISLPILNNLIDAGYRLEVYDRTAETQFLIDSARIIFSHRCDRTLISLKQQTRTNRD